MDHRVHAVLGQRGHGSVAHLRLEPDFFRLDAGMGQQHFGGAVVGRAGGRGRDAQTAQLGNVLSAMARKDPDDFMAHSGQPLHWQALLRIQALGQGHIAQGGANLHLFGRAIHARDAKNRAKTRRPRPSRHHTAGQRL